MAVNTTKVNIPTQLDLNNPRVVLSTLQLFEDFANNPRIVAVDDISTSASATYQQAELQEVIDKMNELLAALRSTNSNILDS